MIIEYNEKIKGNSPKPYLNGANLNLTLPWPNLIQPPQQVHTHEKDDSTEHQPSETTTKLSYMNAWLKVVQTHQTSKMSCQYSMQKGDIHHQILQENFKFTKDINRK